MSSEISQVPEGESLLLFLTYVERLQNDPHSSTETSDPQACESGTTRGLERKWV